MAMSVLPHHPDAAKVAERVLGASGVTPPEHFLAALSDILDIRPHDTLFRIVPEPGTGFGRVECLEKDCIANKKIIELDDYTSLEDGGKSVGIGSLHLLVHHQKESPVHKRAVRARLGSSTPLQTTKPSGDIKPSRSKMTASSQGRKSSSSADASSNKDKKRMLIEISDGEDDVIILPNKGKSTLGPSSSQISASRVALPEQDKGKGRAPLEKNPSPSSVESNQPPASPLSFNSNTAIPLALQSASKRPRLTDPDSESEDTLRSDRSSADSDLVDLSMVYGNASQQEKPAPPSASSQKGTAASYDQHGRIRIRTTNNENVNASYATGNSAYDKFKALQSGKGTFDNDVEMKPASFGASTTARPVPRDMQALRDIPPAVPSSSSPAAADKGKGVGMDSGYLSSIHDTSSSSPGIGASKKFTSSASLLKTGAAAPGSTPPTTAASTTKYPMSADRIRRLREAEKKHSEHERLRRLASARMAQYGTRTKNYKMASIAYAKEMASMEACRKSLDQIRNGTDGPTAGTSASAPSAAPVASGSRTTITQTSTAASQGPTSSGTVADRAYKVARDLYEEQMEEYRAKLIQMTQACNSKAEQKRRVKALMDGIHSKSGKLVYQSTLDRCTLDLVEAQRVLAQHMIKAPKPPVKPASPPVPVLRHDPLLGSYTQSSVPLAKSLSAGAGMPGFHNGFSFTNPTGNAANSYGDDADGLGFLLGRQPNPYAWAASSAAAGPSKTAPAAGHTANLGPTGLPNGAAASAADPFGLGLMDPDSDDGQPYYRRGMEDYAGGNRVYTEAETLSFFNDAAAGFDFNEEGEAALDDAMVTIGIKNQGDVFSGTTIQPFAHQILGIAWMINQEKVRTKIKGGILADDMGLGKTVQTISLIHLHPAKPDDDEKSTLVLAPVALLEQWKNEIDTHTGGRMSSYIYHANGKKITKDDLAKYDVVISTTNTMALEWEMCDAAARAAAKRNAKKAGHEWSKYDEDDWYEKASEQMKPLFTINWRRVVIDEAQNIRNRTTRVSRASLYLNATYRWCLTGTPVTNTLTDIYSLLRFLKVNPWQDWAKWRDEVFKIEKKNPERASKKVQAILKLVLLRRNKDSELNGKRLLNLKPMHINENPVTLSEDERNVYEYIEGKSQQQLSKYIREGTVMKNYAHVLVLLLRLRQCVGHPALVTESFLNSAYTKPEDVVADRADAHNLVIKTCGQANLDSMLKRRSDLAKQRFEDEQAERDIQIEECPICMDPLDASAVITACGHAFCSCIKQWIDLPETAAQNPDGFGEEDRPCPNCRQKVTKATLFPMQYFEPTKEQLAEITGTEVTNDEAEFENEMAEYLKKKNMKAITKSPRKRREGKLGRPSRAVKSRAAKRRVIKDSDDEDDFIDDSEEVNPVAGYTKKTGAESDSEAEVDEIDSDSGDESEAEESDDGDIKEFLRAKKEESKVVHLSNEVKDKFKQKTGREFIPSAKMEAMVKIIRDSPKEDKIMIISQWTSMLDLVAAYLNELGIPWITFRGDMKRSDRDTAVRRFNESKTVKCMLMSLKAGGVGLNMTGGNRAILLDLAWSPAVEAQAFCRMHRLGQKKEVFVERCVVAGSVEDRILTLQDHKKKLADHSLGEGSGEKLKKFGIAELKMLFGMGPEQGHFASKWVHPDIEKANAARNSNTPVAGPSTAPGSTAPGSSACPTQ